MWHSHNYVKTYFSWVFHRWVCTISHTTLTQLRSSCINSVMQPDKATGPESAPALTLGWRMRMALEYADLGVQDAAAELQVSRETIRRWTHDEIEPKRVYLKAWAELCGVSYEFLAGEEDVEIPSLRLVGSDAGSPKLRRGDTPAHRRAGGQTVTDNHGYVERGRRPKTVGPADRTPAAAVAAFNHSYRDFERAVA